jgi:hypothetical protein
MKKIRMLENEAARVIQEAYRKKKIKWITQVREARDRGM